MRAPWRSAPWLRSPATVGGAAFVALVALLPLALDSPYALSTMVLIGIYTIVTIGLCLLMGYAGQISLGQAAFFGMGAYASAILTTRYGWSGWVALAAAAALTGALAWLIGIPILRLRGHYLALATLALGVIVHIVLTEWKEVTGGPTGLPGIPRLAIGSLVFSGDLAYYYLVWTAVIVALAVALNLVRSRPGRALRAVRDSEQAAESLGVDVAGSKLRILVTSAVYASVAGSLYAHYMTFISPAVVEVDLSTRLVLMAAIGGMASIWGAPLGVTVVSLLSLVLREVVPLLTRYGSAEYEIIAYGILLVVIMIYVPQGLVPAAASALQRSAGLRGLLRRARRLPARARE